MYNIQNSSGKNIALMLERGGCVLRPGKYLDLDTMCSRKWILANRDIKHLLRVNALRLVHDSDQTIPEQPIKPITRYVTPAGTTKVVSVKAVDVIDLSQQPDVEVDELGRVYTPEAIVEPVVAEPVIQEPDPPLAATPSITEMSESVQDVTQVAALMAEPEPKKELLVSIPATLTSHMQHREKVVDAIKAAAEIATRDKSTSAARNLDALKTIAQMATEKENTKKRNALEILKHEDAMSQKKEPPKQGE
jgi:hypothetical protein